MSADVFDTNSHFPICCLIEHDEWLESEKRRDRWQHLGSIACPIDSPSLLLLQPSWMLCPPHKPFLGGGDCFLETQFMEKGSVAFSFHSKTSCLAFVNIYKYSPHPFAQWQTPFLTEGENGHLGTVSASGSVLPYCKAGRISCCVCIQVKPVSLSSSWCKWWWWWWWGNLSVRLSAHL